MIFPHLVDFNFEILTKDYLQNNVPTMGFFKKKVITCTIFYTSMFFRFILINCSIKQMDMTKTPEQLMEYRVQTAFAITIWEPIESNL